MSGSDKKLRDKINSIEKLPVGSFEKDAAWQKLQLRVDSKPARAGRKYYYGIAAGIALLFICISFLWPGKGSDTEAVVNTENNKLLPPVQQKTVDSVINTASIIKPRKVSVPVPAKQHKLPAAIMQPSEMLVQEILPPVEPVTIVPTVVCAEPKKVRVVHINDVAEIPDILRTAKPANFITLVQPYPRPVH